jgi:hypothetical protein
MLRGIAMGMLCGLLAGCNASLLAVDQRSMRDRVLILYEDQFMDNLIRAHNRLPVVQIDYGAFTGTQVNTINAGATAGRTSSGGADNAVSRAIEGTFSDSQAGTLTMTGEPVRENTTYESFRAFAGEASYFAVSDQKPAAAHIWRRFRDGKFYYVPDTQIAKDAFFKCFIETTFVANQSEGSRILNELRLNRLNNEPR